jgi:hypothetical protein
MALAFPNNPTVGQIYQEGNSNWQWDGMAWNAYLPTLVATEISTTKPTSGNYEGKIWYNSEEGKFYIYYQDNWIGVG